MEVTKDNFDELLAEICKGIELCTFIAVDTELTGLRPSDEKENYFDTVEERFRFLRQSASKFLLVQFGMVLFFYDEETDEFTHRAYNFYIFPSQFSSAAPNVRFLCEAPSLEFLASWGFDFNKLIYKGIPYLTHVVEQKMKDNYDKKQMYLSEENTSPVSVPEHLRSFMGDAEKQVRSLVSGDLKEVFLDNLNPFQRKLIFNNIKPKFPNLYFETVVRDKDSSDTELMDASSVSEASDTESASNSPAVGTPAAANTSASTSPASARPQTPNKSSRSTYYRALRVAKMTEKEIKAREDEKKELAMENIEKGAGFSKIIRKISETGKIVVGHNMILDVAHSVHQFVSDLPDDLQSFKKLVQETFPNLVDTKLMCCTHPFRELFSTTVLADVLKRVQEEPFGLPGIRKEQKGNFLSYELADEKSHEAGYDAFITGVCFIGLCQYLGQQHTPIKPRVLPTSPLVMPFLNKLYLMRMLDISYMNISGTDLTPTRDHVFHVHCPKEATTKSILQMFHPFGQVQIWWQDDNNLFVSLNDKDQASLVMKNIEFDRPAYRVLPFAQYQQVLAKVKRPHQKSLSRCSNSSSTNNSNNGPPATKGIRQHSSSSTSSTSSNSSEGSPPSTQSVHQKKKRPKTEKSKTGKSSSAAAAASSGKATGNGGAAAAVVGGDSHKETGTASKPSKNNPRFEEPSKWD